MFDFAQCDETNRRQGGSSNHNVDCRSDDNRTPDDGSTEHDYCSANYGSPIDDAAPTPERNSSGGGMFSDDRLRELLSGGRILLECRPRRQRNYRYRRGHRLPRQQRMALGTSVIAGG